MTTTRRAKPRGTATNRRSLYLEVEPETIAKIELLANTLERSKAATLDLLVAHIEVEPDGRPSFWEGPLPGDHTEELDLTG